VCGTKGQDLVIEEGEVGRDYKREVPSLSAIDRLRVLDNLSDEREVEQGLASQPEDAASVSGSFYAAGVDKPEAAEPSGCLSYELP
jgi:hypothetical protein